MGRDVAGPRLAAPPAALRPRRRRRGGAAGFQPTIGRRGDRPIRGAGRGIERAGKRRTRDRWSRVPCGRVPLPPSRPWRPGSSTGPSTSAGGAPPTAGSHPEPTTPGWAASPRRTSSTDEAVARSYLRCSGGRRAEEALRDVPLLLADMPGGVHVGTFIHRVLETADFAAPELADGAPRAGSKPELRVAPSRPGRSRRLVAGLQATVETPLGPLVDDIRLRDLRPWRPARRDELRTAARRRRRAVGRSVGVRHRRPCCGPI